MNKQDIIEYIAKHSDTTKALAGTMLSAFEDAVRDAIAKGDTVTLTGFVTFKTASRAERMGRNPQTGAPIKIPANTVVKIVAGKGLKDVASKRKKKK